MKWLLRIVVLALVLANGIATAASFAIVDQNGNVVNMVEWDGKSAWTPPPGMTAVPATGTSATIGWTFQGGQFVAPISVPPPLAPSTGITASDLAAVLLQKGILSQSDLQSAAVKSAVVAQPVPMITPGP